MAKKAREPRGRYSGTMPTRILEPLEQLAMEEDMPLAYLINKACKEYLERRTN